MDESTWMMVATLVSFLWGRAVKSWPRLPKGLLPWMVLLFGTAVWVAKLRVEGQPLSAAIGSAWKGLAAGLVAIGGHSALKPLLGQLLGDPLATAILGKLPGKVEK